jgi:processive 1,2-diacylglycerol beta-glucosyltransferase
MDPSGRETPWIAEQPDTSPVDVLIVGAGYGLGHNQSAHAIREAVGEVMPGVRAAVADYLDWFPAPFGPLTARGYVAMTKYWPRAYGLLADLSGYLAPRPTWNDLMALVGSDEFWRVIQARQPRLLVATHPLPATVVARRRHQGLPTPPTVLVVTDYSAHPQWIQPGLDAYCLPSGPAGHAFRRAGIPASRIHETGIPIRRPFWDPPPPADSAAGTVVVLGSALGGLGGVNAAVSRLVVALGSERLIVVSGGDRRLYARLSQLARRVGPDRLVVHGRVASIAPLLSQADLLVTKAGGLSLSEGLAMGLPLVVYRPIPGHEVDNARWLQTRGAAVVTTRPADVADAVQYLLAHPDVRRTMAAAARRLGRPRAAHAVAEVLRELLPR